MQPKSKTPDYSKKRWKGGATTEVMTAITHQEGIETSRQLTATVVGEMEVKTANEKPIEEVDQNHHQTRRI